MKRVLVVSTAPVARDGEKLLLDKKFVQGMEAYRDALGEGVGCLLKIGADPPPFRIESRPEDLPFEVTTVDSFEGLSGQHVMNCSLVMASADSFELLPLAEICARAGVPCVLVIENTIQARLRSAVLDHRNPLKLAKSIVWNLNTERKRRAAISCGAALQVNGYPAWKAYRSLNDNSLLYLDNRMRESSFATDAEMAARTQHLKAGKTLRLIHSGRLEAIKGSQDLVPLADALRRKKVDFRLDIYGTGGLEDKVRRGIRRRGLSDRVFLHGTVDFDTELVPLSRTEADVFVSLHRQPDPSCTYVESMGCGLPIVGYDNDMFKSLVADSGGGWCVPLGSVRALADQIETLASHRIEVIDRAARALAFAKRHEFQVVFDRRVEQLKRLLPVSPPSQAPMQPEPSRAGSV